MYVKCLTSWFMGPNRGIAVCIQRLVGKPQVETVDAVSCRGEGEDRVSQGFGQGDSKRRWIVHRTVSYKCA